MDEASRSELQPGDLVDVRYRVRREIARGGMGVIYEAEHIHLGRRVAIKMLSAEARDLPTLGERLLREARALELARHPNVVEAIDSGLEARGTYLVLEMLDGRGLDDLLATRRRLPLSVAVPIVLDLCDALEAAHRAGVVHRDVKPSNVFIARTRARTEQTKLVDFGVASIGKSEVMAKLTQAGERLGTYEYMAPEQLLAEAVDHRADLFAVGVTLYEALVGDVPFPGGPGELLTTLLAGKKPPSISSLLPEVPGALDVVLARTLARDRNTRPQTAVELARDIVAATGITADLARSVEAGPGTDARRAARAPYVTPVRVRDAAGRTHAGHSADLSEVGLQIMLDVPLVAGESVELRFCLPVSGRVLTTAATVRWSRAARLRHATGVELNGVAADALEDIRRFVVLTGV